MYFINVETSFLSKLIESGDFDTVDELQIRQKFLNGRYRRMFKYIQDFKTKYGKVPSEQEFVKKFPQFEMEETLEPMRFYCDELRLKVKHNTIVDGIDECTEALEELETEKAYTVLKKTISKIENDIILGETRKINEDVNRRWEAYLARRNSGGIIGIPTGLIPLDLMTGGIGKTDLITILGFTGVGKTWALIILGVLLAKAGYRVLFITREMNTDQVMKRADAVWAGLSYTDFNRGQLSQKDEEKFRHYLETIEQEEENFIVELSTGGVSNVSALVDKHEPDVVLVDGGYLMTDDEDDDDWKGVMKVWRGFKNIALGKKVPFVTTSQIKESDKATIGKISFSKALANECDVVIALEQTEEMKNDKEVKWKPLKLRDAEMSSWFILNWDFNNMNYEPIYMEGKNLLKPEEEPDTVQRIDEWHDRK